MKKLTLIASIGLMAACIGNAVADSQYSNRYDRSPSRSEHVSEVFYVEGRVVSAEPIYESYWYYRSRGDDRRNDYRETCRIRDVEVYRSSSSAGPARARR